jgi:resuscitation-promoting factor RpfB
MYSLDHPERFGSRLRKSVQNIFMTSIFSIHNHQKNIKQHPIKRLSYLLALVFVVAIPISTREVLASGFSVTSHLYIDGQSINVVSNARTVKDVIESAGFSISKNDLVEPGLETEISDGYRINVFRAVPVYIEDENANINIETAHKTGDAIAKEAGLELFPEDKYEIGASDLSSGNLKPGITLKVQRAKLVTLDLYGAITEVRTQAKTVREFMDEKSIQLQVGDSLVQNPDDQISKGSLIQIKNDTREVQVVEEQIPMPVEQIKDVNKSIGFKEVQIAGSNGSKKVTYEIAKLNGQEVSRTVLEEVILTPAKKQVEVVGAKRVSGSSGNVSAQAQQLMAAAGIPESQWSSAYSLIQKESGWNPNAVNRSSGACGLGQQLPCGKWKHQWNDPVGGLIDANGYVLARYGSWDAAWAHSQRRGWY